MRTSLSFAAMVVVLAASACGGSVESSVSQSPPPANVGAAKPTPPKDDDHVAPPTKPPPTPPAPALLGECGGLAAVVYEPSSSMLSEIDVDSAGIPRSISVSCASKSKPSALAIARDGSVLGLTTEGELVRMSLKASSGTTCTSMGSLPPAPRGYRGLAITREGSTDAYYTLRLGTAEQYLNDGAYHHQIVRINPTAAAASTVTTTTVDATSYPDAIHGWRDGRLLAILHPGTRVIDPLGVVAAVDGPLSGATVVRATAASAPNQLFAIGDVHYAHTYGLPTYRATIPGGAFVQGPDIILPGKSIDGFVVGSAICAYAP